MIADDPDPAVIADQQENADFAAGFSDDKPAKPTKPEPAAPEGATAPVEEAPEYAKITAKEWAELRASLAEKHTAYDAQLAKAWGTIGNQQKLVNELQQQRIGKVEISPASFAEMDKDFPELARQIRSAMQAAFDHAQAAGGATAATTAMDEGRVRTLFAQYSALKEMAALEDAYPAWRDIVGAVDASQQRPDPNNPFRRWLAGKDAAYQARINDSESADDIRRAIRRFQSETRTTSGSAAGTPRDSTRADRIRSAVQPRGDRAAAPAGPSDDDEFEAGYRSR